MAREMWILASLDVVIILALGLYVLRLRKRTLQILNRLDTVVIQLDQLITRKH